MAQRRAVQDGLRAELEVNFDGVQSKTEISLRQPDEEDLRSFLLDFGKFISEAGPLFVPAILSIAHREFGDMASQRWIAEARRAWTDALSAGPISLSIDQVELPPGKLIDLWINGECFHDDLEKARQWRAASKLPLARFIILNAIIDVVSIIGSVRAALISARSALA